jgi:membrane fusion protein, type I secretion system
MGAVQAIATLAPATVEESEAEALEPHVHLSNIVIAGLVAIAVGFGGALAWGLTANLNSAVVATGTVIVGSQKKTVSNFQGGTLKELLVEEGASVERDQPLAVLDETQARSTLAELQGERLGLLAQLARLRTEQAKDDTISFPPELAAAASGIAQSVRMDEERFFERRREIHEGRVAAQEKRIQQFRAESDALASEIGAGEDEQSIIADRLQAVRGLANNGFSTKREVADLARDLAATRGDLGRLNAERAKSEQGEAGAQSDLLSLQAEWFSDIAGSIQETQLKLNDVAQRITAAEDVLARTVIRSPGRGIVMNIQTRTVGSAIVAGQPILDVVPEDDPLVVEAHINPTDVDAVAVGAHTQVRLTAYNVRTLAPLDGEVVYLAPDQERDPKTNAPFYTVRAAITPEALAQHPEVALYPGMPAEILIQHEARKAISYFIEPITSSFRRALHED